MKAAAWLCALALAGCATVGEKLAEAKAGWQGASYEEVVKEWGGPTRSATLPDGRQVHTWRTQQPPVYGGGPRVGLGVFGGSGVGVGVGVGMGFPVGGTAGARTCERTLTFENGAVVEQNWAGDPGYCRFFGRER